MTIKPGDRLPAATFAIKTEDGKKDVTVEEVFGGKKVVLFAVPGAFTPTCHKNHMPGFVREAEAILAKGADAIACTAVNDHHVLKAWAEQQGADGKITMLADAEAQFARALGLSAHMPGLGERSRRYSMIVEDGVVKVLNVEEQPGVNVSGADVILRQL
jgi:peroxiredoxin